jgi:hypothetical protein
MLLFWQLLMPDHQNIRQFMQNGWDGIKFEGDALTAKSTTIQSS